jgi:hypothetical protein
VSDAAVAAGAFELSITPLDVTDLGAFSSETPLDVASIHPSTADRPAIFEVWPGEPGLVSVTATPPADLDALLIARGPHLEELATADSELLGGVETVSLVVGGAEPMFFEVATVGDAVEGSIALQLVLDAYLQELEPNDNAEAALSISPPANAAGALASASDRDWYAVEVEGAGTLTAETSGPGDSSTIDTTLVLYDGDGVSQLARDEDGGGGRTSRISFDLPRAGTYYLVVEAGGAGDAIGAYFLSVDATLR